MAKRKVETPSEEGALDSVSFKGATVEDSLDIKGGLTGDDIPRMGDGDWSDYVMKMFRADELDDGGHPFYAGMRRVSELLLGPTLEVNSCVVQAPIYADGNVTVPAVVSVHLKILFEKGEHINNPHTRIIGAVADCWHGNNEDFWRYATCTAETRAKARCYKEALQLKVCSADEIGRIPPPIAPKTNIDETQVTMIDTLCRKLGINGAAFINAGKSQYPNLRAVPYDKALEMLKTLHSYNNDPSKIRADLRGYKGGWSS